MVKLEKAYLLHCKCELNQMFLDPGAFVIGGNFRDCGGDIAFKDVGGGNVDARDGIAKGENAIKPTPRFCVGDERGALGGARGIAAAMLDAGGD